MGEGEGGGGQDESLLGPPSPSPPAEGRGDFLRLCLFNYGPLSKFNSSPLLLDLSDKRHKNHRFSLLHFEISLFLYHQG
jgi:hypothetical protein